jgi:hypothetical protein
MLDWVSMPEGLDTLLDAAVSPQRRAASAPSLSRGCCSPITA